MTSQLFAICFHTPRPPGLARFWSEVLGWEPGDGPGDDSAILVPGPAGFRIRFVPGDEPRTGPNRAHFDLTSGSPEDQERTVARALEAGGHHLDVGQLPEEGHVVLADPDGNEFCVIEAGNKFLADTGPGLIGALACDGTRTVGHFWSAALGWPLVWDQDEETAIQSPHGGIKITWGGPPVAPKTGTNRLYLELTLPAGADLAAETGRLIALGATRPGAGSGTGMGTGAGTGTGGSDDTHVFLLDPDGNEFSVRRPRR
ncbi:VOC family protein [Streptomyces sp. NPDC005573]|uniref:VOC family protein n=1 Tax=Streptomyces sp. NPDC005573 TaxID=3156890 RepID=UPI0033B8BE99